MGEGQKQSPRAALRRAAVKGMLSWQTRYGARSGEAGMPEPVPRRPEEPLAAYWRQRAAQHDGDSWAGVPLAKYPEDLRTYQHLIWESRADTVIEVGTKWGGSALWFRDQLRAFAAYGRIPPGRVIGIDLITSHAERLLDRADPGWRESISLIEGDVAEAETVERVREGIDPGARCLVVEDSAHTAETTRAALDALAPLVAPGGWFVVEDGVVDLAEVHPEPPLISQTGIRTGGVLATIEEWLATPPGRQFRRRPDLELYGITSNPGGYLQRAETDEEAGGA